MNPPVPEPSEQVRVSHRWSVQRGMAMARFFFGIRGKVSVTDPSGMPFGNELVAYRCGRSIAENLADTRPELRDRAWVVVNRNDRAESYFISIAGAR